jgi:DNA-binding beta-propeller fold protein YncE
MRLLVLAAALLLLPSGGAGAKGEQLRLPYDLESRGRTVWIADGLRHQVLRLDLASGRVEVVAGTGTAGLSGDGGPAAEAQLDEPVGLALDRAGNLYVADLGNDRVRRVGTDGAISTVARVRAPGNVDVAPNGRWLAIASLENAVHRLDLRTGRTTRLARADNPHGLAYARDGTLLVAEQTGLRRFDARGRSTRVVRGDFFKVHVAPGGAVYVLSGSPTGGHVDRVVRGRLVRVAGTGGLTPYRPSQPALKAGLLASDVEVLADGTVLLSQTMPEPALRRLAAGRLVTLMR